MIHPVPSNMPNQQKMVREFKTNSKNILQVGRLLEEYVQRRGVCSMSGSLYDTAWVSMVTKVVDGEPIWLFPASFQCICDAQEESGGWEGADEVDEIVNSLACFLSLQRHYKTDPENTELGDSVDKAKEFVTAKLDEWKMSMTDNTAFEILVPSMLDLLELEGIELKFRDSKNLRDLNQLRLSRLNTSVMHKYPSTILHSLESFIGTIDFDKMSHHLRDGSMMGSPSSTAAYLMNVTNWDDNAERYLRDALENGKRICDGMVTDVYPISTFEFALSTCNILENGLEVDDIHHERIANILSGYIEEGKGLTGFDPSVNADADDTAKTLTALSLLGYPASYDKLIETFEADSHFQCFPFEPDPSFSANCNVLMAFLHSSHPSIYMPQILKCVRYICYEWWNTDGPIQDKWNISDYYPSLLASQSLIRLLHMYESNMLEIPERLLQVKVMVVLFQILSRTLQQQNENGSWGPQGSREETAYAILILANVDSLPFVTPVAGQIESAISRGRRYLKAINALDDIKLTVKDYIWSGKVRYGVENVCHSYVLAALNTPVPQFLLGPRVSGLVSVPTKRLGSFVKFYAKLPMFSGMESWKIKLWLIEGYLFLPDLAKMRLDVFSRAGSNEDKYFEYLPFSWTAPSGLEQVNASAQTLFDMMVISMVNYQVDEFFDGIIARGEQSLITQLRNIIVKLFSSRTPKNAIYDVDTIQGYDREIYQQLANLLHFVLGHPRIQNASANDQKHLELELKAYLLAHTQQCEDGLKLRLLGWQKTYSSPPSSYIRWIHNTAADHLSTQYSFAFLICLLGNDSDYLPTPEINYIAQDCCVHLSATCRMFNDYGSFERDKKEYNLNSLLFPEFDGNAKTEKDLRTELLRLAKYERKCLALSFEELKDACGDNNRRIYDMTRMFYNASEIYTEVYEVKDLNSLRLS